MYIQITTRCNMTCAHCCFSCTAEGEDMSCEVYAKALDVAGDCISIGGGEPTLHSHFWEFLLDAVVYADNVWLATNGSRTKDALRLAALAKKKAIGCSLSLDEYHAPIDPKVVKAFKGIGIDGSIKDTSNHLASVGRAAENQLDGQDGCGCPGGVIKPNGDIFVCGCPDSIQIGTVWEPQIEVLEEYEYDCIRGNGYL